MTCAVVGCGDVPTVRATLIAKMPSPTRLPYGAKLCDDHGSSDEGRSYKILNAEPMSD